MAGARRGGRGRGGRSGADGDGRRDEGRGGRAQGDAFSASLRDALAEALAVSGDRVEVRVTLDGSVVEDREVTTVVVRSVEPPAVDAGRDGPRRDEPRREESRRDRDAEDREGDGGQEVRMVTPEELDEEAEAAADLLEGLLDAMDLPGDLRIQVQETHAEVEIVGAGEGVLIGRRGQTLEALQDLVRTAMQRRFERRSRVLVDVDGYRARRLEKLIERAEEAVQEVLATGEPQRLEPMDSIERRIVHQRVAAHEGVVSRSHGREPARRIEIELADD